MPNIDPVAAMVRRTGRLMRRLVLERKLWVTSIQRSVIRMAGFWGPEYEQHLQRAHHVKHAGSSGSSCIIESTQSLTVWRSCLPVTHWLPTIWKWLPQYIYREYKIASSWLNPSGNKCVAYQDYLPGILCLVYISTLHAYYCHDSRGEPAGRHYTPAPS